MKFTLRPYQDRAIDAAFDAWNRGVQRPAIVQATGTGKTVVFSEIMSRVVREERARPVLLVHRDELVDQAVAKLASTDPGLAIGVIKAERHEVRADVCVASVQTLVRRLGTGPKGVPFDRFNVLITDECHHAAANSYVSIYKHFGGLPLEEYCRGQNAHSNTRMLGVTATLARADGIPLGHIWQEVVFEYGTMQGIMDGYLVAPHAERAVMQDLDLSKVRSIGGDYSEGALGTALFKSGTAIAEKLIASAMGPRGLRRTIVFAPTVACAEMWAEDFAAAGIRCRVVTGNTPKDLRHAAYRDTASGSNDALISVMVLTEGFDLPSVEVAVIGRPTKSLTLYTQMVGRVLRPSPETGKTSALVLDVCGVMDQQLTTMIDLGLPPQCDCGTCGCDFQHLCPQLCRCPRSLKGKLKRPCIICARTWREQPKAEREPCHHYGRNGHVVGCPHTCEGLGKPGEFEDDDPAEILDPEAVEPAEMFIDESDITTRKVNLFGKELVPAARQAPRPKTKPKAWRQTRNGLPYLPATSNFEYLVFLFQDPDGTWSVGEKASKGGGRATRLATGLDFRAAVIEAESSHPTGGWLGRQLQGIATEGQLAILQRAHIDIPPYCTKQQASDLISDLFASRSLD